MDAATARRGPRPSATADRVLRRRGMEVLTGTRIVSDWVLEALLPRQTVQFGLVRSPAVPLSGGLL